MREIWGLMPAAGKATRLAAMPGSPPQGPSKEILPLPPAPRTAPPIRARRRASPARTCSTTSASPASTRALVLLRQGKWDIPKRLGDGAEFGVELAYRVLPAATRGVPFTLATAAPFLGDRMAALGFPDILVQPRDLLARLVRHRERNQSDVALALVPCDRPQSSDLVEVDAARQGASGSRSSPETTTLKWTWAFAVWTPRFTRFLLQVDRGLQRALRAPRPRAASSPTSSSARSPRASRSTPSPEPQASCSTSARPRALAPPPGFTRRSYDRRPRRGTSTGRPAALLHRPAIAASSASSRRGWWWTSQSRPTPAARARSATSPATEWPVGRRDRARPPRPREPDLVQQELRRRARTPRSPGRSPCRSRRRARRRAHADRAAGVVLPAHPQAEGPDLELARPYGDDLDRHRPALDRQTGKKRRREQLRDPLRAELGERRRRRVDAHRPVGARRRAGRRARRRGRGGSA